MSSLTTLFVVGPEEYVEFNEHLGSKAFLEHVWDQSTTPLRDGETADSRLQSAGARISQTPPPRIEFPTILRIKGSGNKYKPSGKWISWDELRRQNPLAVSAPPSLDEFQRRGGKVGSGEKLEPGEWLTEESIGIKKAKKAAQADDSKVAKGASESVYAPPAEDQEAAEWVSLAHDRDGSRTPLGSELDICSVNTTPQCKTGHAPETPMMQPPTPKLGQEPKPRKSTRSLFERFVSDELSPEMPRADLPCFSAKAKQASSQEPQSPPPAPSSSRTAASVQASVLSTPARQPSDLPLVSPSTARTPLSATHPLPETPLKVPHPPRAPLAERRSRPNVTPITPATHGTTDERAPRGLGLGLTPTRPNMFGGPLSPVQFRAPPSSRRRPLEATLTEAAAEHQEDLREEEQASSSHAPLADEASSQRPSFSSDSSSGGPALRGGKATDEIEAMLQRLRTARTGLGNSGGTNASRWASQDSAGSAEAGTSTGRKPAALLARLSAAPAVDLVDGNKDANKVITNQDHSVQPAAQQDADQASTSTVRSEDKAGAKKKKKLTLKERREKAKEKKRQAAALAKSADSSTTKRSEEASSSVDASTIDSRSGPAKQHQPSAFKEEFSVGSTVHNISAAPSTARSQSVSSGVSSASAMSRAPSAPSAPATTTSLPPTEPKAMRKSSAARAAAPRAVQPQQAPQASATSLSPPPAAPPKTEVSPPSHASVEKAPLAVQSPGEPTQAPTEAPEAAPAEAAPAESAPVEAPSVGHSRQSSTAHVDWADDEDDEDALPDLDDWGITIPASDSSAAIPPTRPAISATPPTGPKSDLMARQSSQTSPPSALQSDNRSAQSSAQPDSNVSSEQRGHPPTGPRGLRIAGRASSNPQTDSNAGGIRIAGVASQSNDGSKDQQPAKRRELLPGTVNSMHAPSAHDEGNSEDPGHFTGRKGRRGGPAPRQNGSAHSHINGRGLPPHLQQDVRAEPSQPAQQPQGRRTELKERPRPKLTGDGAFARLAMGIVGVKNAAVGASSSKEAKAATSDTKSVPVPQDQPVKHVENGASGAPKHNGGRGGRSGRGSARGGRGGGRRGT